MVEDLPAQLTLLRKWFTNKSTIGELMFLGRFECFVLEDTSRKEKIYGKTAIPEGTYEIVLSYSERFKTYLPLLLDVPNFEGVRIHTGNTPADTEGCLILGMKRMEDAVGESRIAMKAFMEKLEPLVKKEKVYIKIHGGVHALA